jgi:hypothetical protein
VFRLEEVLVQKESELSSRVLQLNDSLKSALNQVYDEFEDHLEAINENTSEIQENYAYFCELDNKIAKLNDRIDEIHNILSKLTGKKVRKIASFDDIDPLTSDEKNVFMNLYTEAVPVSYADLAKKMQMPIPLVREYVTHLLEKGVPVQKTYKNTIPHILLDPRFKNLQAKTNILKIEQRILV